MTTTPSGPYSIIPDNGSAGGVVVGPGVSNWRPCRNVDDGFNRVTDAYAAGQESLRTCLAEVERERDKERSINARWQEMNRCQVDQIRTLTTQLSALREALEGIDRYDMVLEKCLGQPHIMSKKSVDGAWVLRHEALSALTPKEHDQTPIPGLPTTGTATVRYYDAGQVEPCPPNRDEEGHECVPQPKEPDQ